MSRNGMAASAPSWRSSLTATAMSSIVEELFPACLEAVATRDDETAGILRKALLILGRHLARALGPKLAGAAIN